MVVSAEPMGLKLLRVNLSSRLTRALLRNFGLGREKQNLSSSRASSLI